ncbi:MAG: pantoate--beta-alanine ligase [Opitutales bacterium]
MPVIPLMQTIQTIPEMKRLAAEWRAAGKTVALVPTMGALHAGQEALIRAAAQRAEIVVVAAFVNPLQFAPNELMARYPRNPEEDLQLCERTGATVAFTPAPETMYPRNYATYVNEDLLSKPLCGVSRPNHFRGVTTLMVKLFNLVRPQFVYFGQKTAQRAAVVRKMIRDLDFDAEVVVVPTAREADGLAYGVRNRELSTSQRQEALALSKALRKAQEMVAAGVRSPDRLIAEVTHILGEHRRVRVIYVAMVDQETMEPVRHQLEPGRCLLAISVWIDEIRLIDNVVL